MAKSLKSGRTRLSSTAKKPAVAKKRTVKAANARRREQTKRAESADTTQQGNRANVRQNTTRQGNRRSA